MTRKQIWRASGAALLFAVLSHATATAEEAPQLVAQPLGASAGATAGHFRDPARMAPLSHE